MRQRNGPKQLPAEINRYYLRKVWNAVSGSFQGET